jgi:hypothetical protein
MRHIALKDLSLVADETGIVRKTLMMLYKNPAVAK